MGYRANMTRDYRGKHPLLANFDTNMMQAEYGESVSHHEHLKHKSKQKRLLDMRRATSKNVRVIGDALHEAGFHDRKVFDIEVGQAMAFVKIGMNTVRSIRGSLYLNDKKFRNVKVAGSRIRGWSTI